jgi:hypothetical protein
MVQSAEREPVALFVRSAGLVPFDMRGFQGDRDGSEPDIEAADRAAVLVGAQDAVAEIRAPRDDNPGFDGELDADRFEMSWWMLSGKLALRRSWTISRASCLSCASLS